MNYAFNKVKPELNSQAACKLTAPKTKQNKKDKQNTAESSLKVIGQFLWWLAKVPPDSAFGSSRIASGVKTTVHWQGNAPFKMCT